MNSLGADESDISPADYLLRLGKAGEGPHDIATAALMLAALDHPEKKLAPYFAHLAELSEAARAEATFARDGESAARALGELFTNRFGYDGDRLAYDDPGQRRSDDGDRAPPRSARGARHSLHACRARRAGWTPRACMLPGISCSSSPSGAARRWSIRSPAALPWNASR